MAATSSPTRSSRVHSVALLGVREQLQLVRFFSALALKEHVLPRLKVRPLVAELFLTENCNLRCTSCACWRTHTSEELSTEEWKDIIDQLVALRIVKLNFTGGEPLIRRDAIELMAYAHDRGARAIHLNTNGILLDERRRAAVLAAGVRSFNLSVDGPSPEIHDAIRGRDGAFTTTVEHLRALLAQRDEYKLKIRLSFTVLRDNVAALPEIARLAQELRVRLFLNLGTDTTFLFRDTEVSAVARVLPEALQESLAQLEDIKRADERWLPRYSDLRYMRGHFSELVQRDLPCAESQLKLMIHSRGEVGGCWGHDPSANARDRRVRDIIDSDAYHAEHDKYFRKECVGCGSNYSLNLRRKPLTYLEDLRWRRGRRTLVEP